MEPRLTERVRARVRDHLPDVGYGMCTLALSLIGMWLALSAMKGGSRIALAIIVGFIGLGTLAFLVWKAIRGVRVSSLEKKVRKLKNVNGDLREALGDSSALYQLQFNGLLAQFADQTLNYGNTERISVYRHDADKDEFNIIARYSKDSRLNSNGSRVTYPADEGVISEAWKTGHCTPNPLPDPDRDLNSYLESTERDWRIRTEVAQHFRMKSRCFAAYTLRHPDGPGHENIAVIVFESKVTGSLRTDVLEEQVCKTDGSLGPIGDTLARFILNTEAIQTRSDIASDEEV